MNKYIKRILAASIFMAVSFITLKLLNYILIDDATSYTRIMMHELYNSEKNIDIAFVGSSHVYRSVDPDIIDEKLGCYCFDASSSSQKMDGSYALIQELDTHNNLKKVYLELYYGVARVESNEERVQMTPTYIISDYMKPSLKKLSYLCNASSRKYWVNSFLPISRNRKDIFDTEFIKENINSKNNVDYKKYNAINDYKYKGYVGGTSDVSNKFISSTSMYNPISNMPDKNSDWYKYLDKIVIYCKQHNIELEFFISPENSWKLNSKGNYQEYHDFIQQIADDYNITFVDYNLLRLEYFNSCDRTIFADLHGHLNEKGADIFSNLFCMYNTGKISKETLFYNNYEEKRNAEDFTVFGIAGPQKNDEDEDSVSDDTGTDDKKYFVVANRDNVLYRLFVINENGDERLIQDYNTNSCFSLPYNEHGKVIINWKTDDSPISETSNEMIFEY